MAILLTDDQIELIARRAAEIDTERTGPSIDPTTSPYLTIPEAADHLRCKRQRIDDLLSAGRLTRIKEGRRTLVLRTEIDAHLRTKRRSSVAPTLPHTPKHPANRAVQA